jgi:hypothetical protein
MDIHEFSYDILDDLKYNPSICLVSQRGGGKSFLLDSLMKKLDKKYKYSHIFAFSQTDKVTGQMSRFVPDSFIFDSLEPLQSIIDTRLDSQTPIKERSNICIIMNDISGLREQNTYNKNSKSIKNSGNLEKLFSLGRHQLRCTVILLLQSLVMVTPLIRYNSDITFFWTPKSSLVRKKITDEYLGLVTRKEAIQVYESVFDGTPYQCLVINSWVQGTTELNQFVFKFLAPVQNKWKSGFVKRNGKPKTKKISNIKPTKKNNIFSIYNVNEVKTDNLRTGKIPIQKKKRAKASKLSAY